MQQRNRACGLTLTFTLAMAAGLTWARAATGLPPTVSRNGCTMVHGATSTKFTRMTLLDGRMLFATSGTQVTQQPPTFGQHTKPSGET